MHGLDQVAEEVLAGGEERRCTELHIFSYAYLSFVIKAEI
jgi:hypothetical protein